MLNAINIRTVLWSFLGSFCGIWAIAELGAQLEMHITDVLFLVGSFGASAVLVYGAPQAEFSQPRNLIYGHLISAFIGVSVYQYLPADFSIAAALAVALSILAMQLSNTLHPPGGATALIAVIGHEQIHDMGYYYVIAPIGAGSLILFVIALLLSKISSDESWQYPND